MKLDFQKSIATSQATLPLVGIVALALWFLLPTGHTTTPAFGADYGLWSLVPAILKEGWGAQCLGAVCASAAVYLMAELNNANSLLRVGSRMLGSTLAVLLAFAVVVHQNPQPGNVLAILMLISLFPLFAAYQNPSPQLTFLTFLPLSLASLLFPKILWFIPFYWLAQGYLRAFSIRCFTASLITILLPYWFYGGIAMLTGTLGLFLEHVNAIINFTLHDYRSIDLRNLLTLAFLVILFIIGLIDIYFHQFRDKTRTRITYNLMVIFGMATILFIILQPAYLQTLLPPLLVSTAILFGHFFTLTRTWVSHISCILLLLMAIAIVTAQYLCDEHLNFALPSFP